MKLSKSNLLVTYFLLLISRKFCHPLTNNRNCFIIVNKRKCLRKGIKEKQDRHFLKFWVFSITIKLIEEWRIKMKNCIKESLSVGYNTCRATLPQNLHYNTRTSKESSGILLLPLSVRPSVCPFWGPGVWLHSVLLKRKEITVFYTLFYFFLQWCNIMCMI